MNDKRYRCKAILTVCLQSFVCELQKKKGVIIFSEINERHHSYTANDVNILIQFSQ